MSGPLHATVRVDSSRWNCRLADGAGRLVGEASGSVSPVAVTIEARRGPPGTVLGPTVRALRSEGLGPIHYWRDPDDPVGEAILGASGLEARGRWHRYERALDSLRAGLPPPFTTRPATDPTPALLELLAWSFDRAPGYAHASPESLFEHFAQIAGGRPDPELWRIVDYGGRPCGILLMQCPDTVGTHLALGLAPWARGRGWGPALHALGLRMLARHGARHYADDTWDENRSMRTVFERNGCVATGVVDLFISNDRPGGSESNRSG